jgi:hypothetical protein
MAAVLATAMSGRATADDGPPAKEPGPKAIGKLYTWKAADGLAYDYFLPKSYDPEKGITLTFILHGSNGWKGWGFSMHAAGEFRPEDFVVSPEGTTPNGQGGFNSLQTTKDLERFHALHQELKEKVKVNATYIYGLSQGSFFAHFYAGMHGDQVDGIVAHGSGLWLGSGLKKANHHQSISVMHGRGDPVYPYGGGVSAHQGYVDAKYPTLTFRTLQLDLHWAPWGHQAQQLAWCEGMNSDDPERVAHNLRWLIDVKDSDGWFRDPVASYRVAARAAEMEGVDPKTQAAAKKLMKSVEDAATAHVAAIEKSHAKTKGKLTDGADWVGHAHYFIRDWRGVPAADAFVKEWSKTVDKHDDAAKDGWTDYYKALEKGKTADAMSAAVKAIEKGFLNYWTADAEMLANLAKWRDDAKKHGIGKNHVKRYDAVVKPYLEAREKGTKAYAGINKKM